MKISFLKSHLSYEEQIALLESRGLTISNKQFAIKKLQHLNYYRLSAYFYPFFQKKNSFIEDTRFEDIIQLYYFDKVKEFILDRYRKDGVKELDEKNLSTLVKLSGNDSRSLRKSFGEYNIRYEYFRLQRKIYR